MGYSQVISLLERKTSRVLHLVFVKSGLEYETHAANPCLKFEVGMLERVQRRRTKIVKGLSALSYEERLRHNLFPLSYHRLLGDQILAYRILNDNFGIIMSYLFRSSRTNHLR